MKKEEVEMYTDTIKDDFIGYHIFITLFNGDIDAWESYLENEASRKQYVSDYPFLLWLKGQLSEDKKLLKRLRKFVKATKHLLPTEEDN